MYAAHIMKFVDLKIAALFSVRLLDLMINNWSIFTYYTNDYNRGSKEPFIIL